MAGANEQAGVRAITVVPSECGTAGWEGTKSKTKRKTPKSKLPGVSATQKSVAAFFTSGNKPELQNKSQKKGEEVSEVNSFELSGEHRSNCIPSPTKKIIKKSRSVASSQKVLLQKQNEGGGGLTKIVQKNCENMLVLNQSQNWRQKLQVKVKSESIFVILPPKTNQCSLYFT